MKKLDSRIVDELAQKLDKNPATVKKDIYLLVRKYPTATKNAVAQVYAEQNGKTVFRLLDKEDRNSMPNISVDKSQVRVAQAQKKPRRKERIIQFIQLRSYESFKRDHVEEINRAYTYKCYTACFVLCRKVVENLVLDVMELKFPRNEGDNLSLYFDTNQGRYRDFSELLANISNKRDDFGPDAKLVERIVSKANVFKRQANDTAHSWYYIIKNPEELEDLHVQDLIDYLETLLDRTRESQMKVPGP